MKLNQQNRAMLNALVSKFTPKVLAEYQKDLQRIYSDAKKCHLKPWELDDAVINCVLYHAGV